MPARELSTNGQRQYIRFASLGDAFTCSPDDSGPRPLRGWAELLADSLAADHDVSYWNVADPRATTADVRRNQAGAALAHQPHLASLVAGLRDACRSDWDADTVRYRIMRVADELSWCGAVILTVRFHDHAKLLQGGTERTRLVSARIAELNEFYDEVEDAYGGLRLDLEAIPEIGQREFWSSHPLQPSATGQLAIAQGFAALMVEHGLEFSRHGLGQPAAA